MKSPLVLGLLLLFCAGYALAATSVDALNFVVNSNYFLYDGETYTPPNVPVKYEGKGYWVVPVTSGSDVITYFPVSSETGLLSDSRAVNRGLFEVADNLRELQLLKSSLSAGTGVEWLFTQKYQTIFNETALNLNDGIFSLNTVETTLKDNHVEGDVSGLRSSLRQMSLSSSELSAKISEAYSAENSFVTAPSEDNLSAMKGSYAKVFDLISALNSSSLAYQTGLTKLKNAISVSSLDAQTKSQLEPLLRLPQGLGALRNYNLGATQLKQALDARFSSSSLRIDSLLEQLDERIAKNNVHRLIYTSNATLAKETGFDSLSKAQATILAPENKGLWENQPKVNELESDYKNAADYYSKRQFAQAQKSAVRAIDDAVSVYKKGRKTAPTASTDISRDLLFKAAGILLVLLAILYVVNNRKKVGEMVTGKAEEIDPYK